MKVLLLNAPPIKKMGIVGQIYPPLGILYLAAYVRERSADYEFKAVDGYQHTIEEALDAIREFGPDILGVSMTTQSASGGYEIIRRVKSSMPRVFVVTGGPHPTIMPEEPIQKAGADVSVVGEGEETFFELLEAVRKKSDYGHIAGTAVLRGGKVECNTPRKFIANIDTIPFPARDLIDIRKYPGYHYKRREWDTSYISGRGCPYSCTYCSDPVWKVQKPYLRLRSPENIIAEIEFLKKTYGVTEFYDQTDLLNGNIKWAKNLCRAIIAKNLDIKWKVQMTVKNVDDELAELMSQSGCWLGFLGIETGNDETLRGISKRSDHATVEKSLTMLKNHGVTTFALLMAFNVWEENGELKF